MRAVATKSLVIWPRACWLEACFSATGDPVRRFPWPQGGAARRAVRKHRAPKGALRLEKHFSSVQDEILVRKHRAPNGALRRGRGVCLLGCEYPRQKAPGAKWCIKTAQQGSFFSSLLWGRVRKHRAPKGALRPCYHPHLLTNYKLSQKAPSAKRCIKTWGEPPLRSACLSESESTERQ